MKKVLVALFITTLLAACGASTKTKSSGILGNSKTLFTQDIRKLIEESADLRDVQFYITRKITMKREQSKEELEVTAEGKVVIKEGDIEEKIVLEKELPGVVTEIYDDRLHVSFREGSFLVFKRDFGGTYSLQADWDFRGYGRIQYGTETYQIDPDGREAKLAIDKQFKKENQEDDKQEQGRRVSGGF